MDSAEVQIVCQEIRKILEERDGEIFLYLKFFEKIIALFRRKSARASYMTSPSP